MAQTPEGKVKKFIDDFVKEHFEDAWRYCPPGGMYGNGGVPDRIYLWHGVFFVIEAKADEDRDPTTLQWKHLRHIARQGGVSAVVRGRDLAKLLRLKEIILKRAKAYESAIQRLSMADEESGAQAVSSSGRDD